MHFSPDNFCNRAREIVTGDFFMAERSMPLDAVRVAASGIPIGSGTAPTSVTRGISFDNAETALLTFAIPQDYAETNDKCFLRLREMPSANTGFTTDLGITTDQIIFRAGATENATASTAVAEPATSSAGRLVRENVLNISGRGYKAGDTVQLTLDGNNSSVTEIILLGIDLLYGSTFRAGNDDDNNRA